MTSRYMSWAPGILFRLADIELPLAQLCYHFDWKLPGDELDLTEKFGTISRPKNHPHFIPVPYDPTRLMH